jgi:nucleoside phosphorylase
MAIRGRLGHARIAIMTAIPEEFSAVKRIAKFQAFASKTPWMCAANNATNDYDIIITQAVDSSSSPCRDLLSDIKEKFMPEFFILCGIAGGNKNWGADLGNIIIADHIEGYETQKLSGGTARHQKTAHDHPSYFLRTIAQRVREADNWRSRIAADRPRGGKVPVVVDGNLISGEKLLGDQENEYQKHILASFPNAKAVDMEAIGLARGVYSARATRHYNAQYLVVKAISDRIHKPGNQKERDAWRNYASEVAASFAVAIAEEVLACT